MKKRFLLLILGIRCISLYAQSYENREKNLLWPMSDSNRGENILMTPDDQIYNKWRKIDEPFGHVLIGGREGTEILAVCDGTIIDAAYTYLPEFLCSWSGETYEELQGSVNKSDPEGTKWINYSLRIKVAPGIIINYHGLTAPAARLWKTGESVKRGDILGTLGNSVRSINQPALDISLDVNGKRGDIGKVLLGVESTASIKKVKNMKSYQHSPEVLIEALDIMKTSLMEGHPALYEYSSREEIEDSFQTARNKLTRPMASDQFYGVLMPVIISVKDNHTYLTRRYLYEGEESYSPRLYFPVKTAYSRKKLYIKEDPTGQTQAGDEIISLNGKPFKEIIEEVKPLTGIGDGGVESWCDFLLNENFGDYFLLSENPAPRDNLVLGFSDRKEVAYSLKTETPDFLQQKRPDTSYQYKRLSPQTVYLKIFGMSLQETEKEEIRSLFTDEIKENDTVILDIRSNLGGDIEGTFFIYSLFAQERFPSGKENKVNSNRSYPFFQYTENYSPDAILYENFHTLPNREGYYLSRENDPDHFLFIEPDENRFNGEVYVLTNGGTGSAAVQLAAYFKHFNRGIIVGEEGACAYHKMNGLDFAKVRLGETGLLLNIPLVHMVLFDDNDTANPVGRSVIPDYPVVQTIDDTLEGKDTVFEYTKELIHQKEQKKQFRLIASLISFFILATIIAFLIFKKTQRTKN